MRTAAQDIAVAVFVFGGLLLLVLAAPPGGALVFLAKGFFTAWVLLENGAIAIATYGFLIVLFTVFPALAVRTIIRNRRELATRTDLTPIERHRLEDGIRNTIAVGIAVGPVAVAFFLVAVFQGPVVFLQMEPFSW